MFINNRIYSDLFMNFDLLDASNRMMMNLKKWKNKSKKTLKRAMIIITHTTNN